MATTYKIRLKRFNGTDYDTLNLVSQNIIMSSGNDLQTDFTNLDNSIDDIVYVGGTAPTDPDTKIWLDTDSGGASAVNSINGKAGTVILDADDVGAMSDWELVWVNASPTSSFAPQSIQLDLSSYDFVAIVFRWSSADSGTWMPIVPVGGYLTASNFYNYRTIREEDIQPTHIQFYGGFKGQYNASASSDNTFAIPQKVYGIKGEITI